MDPEHNEDGEFHYNNILNKKARAVKLLIKEDLPDITVVEIKYSIK